MKRLELFSIVFLFLLGFFIRFFFFGFSDIPLQAASSDATYHFVMTDVYEDIFPSFVAQGYVGAVNGQPPIFYAFSSFLSWIFSLSYWDASWLLVCLLGAIQIVLLYFFVRLLFSKEVAFLSGLLLCLPIPFSLWAGYYANGIFLTLFGQTILVGQLTLLVYYYKNPRLDIMFFLGAITFLQIFTHVTETLFFTPLLLCFLLFKYYVSRARFFLWHGLLYLGFVFLGLLLLLPKLLYVWLPMNPNGLGFFTVPQALPFLVMLMKKLSFFSFPLLVLLLALFGMIVLIRKKDYVFPLIFFYFLFLTYVPLFFLGNAEYVIKLRYFYPILFYPLVGVGLIFLQQKICERFGKNQMMVVGRGIFTLFILAILVFGGISYCAAKEQRYTPMNEDRWSTLLWIEQHTPSDSKVLFLDGFYEWHALFSRRVSFEANPAVLREEGLGEMIVGTWVGHSHTLAQTNNWFSYTPRREITKLNYLDDTVPLALFDYVVMREGAFDLESYTVVYDQKGFLVLEK